MQVRRRILDARSGNVLIGPSAEAIVPLIICGLKNRSALQVVHQVVRVVRRRMADRALGLAEEQLLAAHLRFARLRRIELAEHVELGRRREIEQFLELRHEMDLAAALENVHALLRGNHRVAVEVGRPLFELGEVFDRLRAPAASRTAAGCSRRAATAYRCDGGIPAGGCRRPGASAPLVCPLAWQSKQATPRLGFTVRRSSVGLNCCCGNGVTSSRSPSSCFGFRMPLNSSKKLSIVTSLPFDTSPRSGRVVRKIGGGKLGQKMIGQIEIEIEAGQVAIFLLLDFVDVELGKQHAAFGMIGMRQRQEALRAKCRLCESPPAVMSPSLSHVMPAGKLGPDAALNRLVRAATS